MYIADCTEVRPASLRKRWMAYLSWGDLQAGWTFSPLLLHHLQTANHWAGRSRTSRTSRTLHADTHWLGVVKRQLFSTSASYSPSPPMFLFFSLNLFSLYRLYLINYFIYLIADLCQEKYPFIKVWTCSYACPLFVSLSSAINQIWNVPTKNELLNRLDLGLKGRKTERKRKREKEHTSTEPSWKIPDATDSTFSEAVDHKHEVNVLFKGEAALL